MALVLMVAAAPTAWSEPRPIGLAEALAAEASAPAAAAQDQRARAAMAEADAAGAWPGTTLSIASSRLTARLVTTVAIPLPLAGGPAAARRTAAAQRGVVEAETDAARLDRRLAVTLAWLALARAQAAVALGAETVEQTRQLEAAAQARLDVGDAPAMELEAARAARVRAEAEAGSAATEVEARGAELAGLLGWDPTVAVVADGALPSPSPPPSLDELRRAAAGHPDARVAGAAVTVAHAASDEARRARWPLIALDLEVSAFDPTQPGTDVRAGVTVELPLLGRGQARLDAARAGERVARLADLAIAAQLDATIVAAHRRAAAAIARARRFSDEVLPAQLRASELATRAYREGGAALASALLAQRELVAVRVEVLDAIYAAAVARATLSRASGAP